MLRNPQFYDEEKDAALFKLDNGYITRAGDALFEKTSKWPTLLGLEEGDVSSQIHWPENLDIQRIHIADAERTFFNDARRKSLIKFLALLNHKFRDYAQGLSYATSFLLLTLDEPTTYAVLSHLNQNERYIPGYWRHEAVVFATDAYVFEELLHKFLPEAQQHLAANFIFPDTYCQKWFVGLCVHVLPLETLFVFFEKFMQHGFRFLMQFGLSLVKRLQSVLLKTTDPSTIFGILRLDAIVLHRVLGECDVTQLTLEIIDDVVSFDLSDVDFASARVAAYNAKLKARLESAATFLESTKEATNDDEEDEEEEEYEAMECEVCGNMGEIFCRDCKLKLCESCHKKGKQGHKPSHNTIDINEMTEEDRVVEEEEQDREAQELEKGVKKLEI